jgi:3-carboxy-cis,cis-muconate cycloisomerase
MPQKRNPMTSEYLIASARLLRGSVGVLLDGGAHAGERDMGAWSVEWIALPQACILASSVADKLAWILAGLSVDAPRMAVNLELTRGGIVAEELMMRLGRTIGHETAHELVGHAAREAASAGTTLAQELHRFGDAVALGAPAEYTGWSAEQARATATRIRGSLAALDAEQAG